MDILAELKLVPYDGSQDSTKHPLLIRPDDIVSSDNIIYTTYSTKKKRPGLKKQFQAVVPGGRPILSGFDFFRLGTQRTVAYNGNRLYAFNPSGVLDDITGPYSLPQNEVVSFLAFQGLLVIFFSGGNFAPKRWTQSGNIVDLSATAPNAPFGRVWLNKLWLPDPTVPGRLLHSNTGTVDFTGGDSGSIDLDVNDDNPDGLTAIFPPFFGAQGALYVTKRFSLYKISPVFLSDGTLQFAPTKISDGIGCLSHNAVVAISSVIMFPSDLGVHVLSSTDKLSEVETDFVSSQIQPEWVNGVNFNRAKYMYAAYDRTLSSYIVAFPSISRLYPDSVWGYSILAKKWYKWRNFNHTCLFRYLDPITKRVRTMVGSKTGQLGVLDETKTTDYGIPFNLTFQSGLITPSGMVQDQFCFSNLTAVFVPQLKGSFTITYKIDGRTIETLTFNMEDTSLGDSLGVDFIPGQSVLGGIPKVNVSKKEVKGSGMIYEFFLEHKGQSFVDGEEGFEFLGLILDVDRVSPNVMGTTVA